MHDGRRPRADRMMLAAVRQSRLTSRTGIAGWLRDTLLRAVPPRHVRDRRPGGQ
ncbi:hypothetical protein [Nonomuraea sp. NPDC050691]|uniref:hypothetical protein n=1 Tax=Nonomuraea sp. NPDC050691 TaxID=3155661 RepID=UPI0033C60723